MSPDSKTQTPQAKTSGGLLGRIFGRGEHENSGADAHSGKPTRSTLDLADARQQGELASRKARMPVKEERSRPWGDHREFMKQTAFGSRPCSGSEVSSVHFPPPQKK